MNTATALPSRAHAVGSASSCVMSKANEGLIERRILLHCGPAFGFHKGLGSVVLIFAALQYQSVFDVVHVLTLAQTHSSFKVLCVTS